MILKPSDAVVVSLFDRTTNMVKPWSEAGWLCYCVDIQHPPGETREGNIIKIGGDIMRWMPPRSRVKITFGFPPCFTGDTLVLTRRGYKRIDAIMIGEEVLTHVGRWRKVTDRQMRFADTTRVIRVAGSGELTTTDEHPFYARFRKWKGKNKSSGRRVKSESQPEWIPAADLKTGHLVGMVLPPEEAVDISDDLLWLMGRYTADGHVRRRDGRVDDVCFSIGKHKADAFRDRSGGDLHEEVMDTAIRFHLSRGTKFNSQFVQFGCGAENKEIPGWVMALPKSQAAVFLDGYLSGDGYKRDNKITASSVSRKLIRGLCVVMRRVFGRSPSVSYFKRQPTTVIEGRTVNQMPSLGVFMTREGRTLATIEGDRTWNAFKKSTPGPSATVFNLAVEDDESYVVDACIVHNCTNLSVSGARWFQEKGLGALCEGLNLFARAVELAEYIGAPYMLENPVSVVSSHYRKPDHSFDPCDYAGYLTGAEEKAAEAYTKKTCLWCSEDFVMPCKQGVSPTLGSKMHKLPPSAERADLRAVTSKGFARAVFLANHKTNTA